MSALIAVEDAAFLQLTAHIGSIWDLVDEAPNVQENVGFCCCVR